ncbi:hypothetical protein NA56DRAFT_125434 [Hyaloscypha hepaticicola]|uniref:Uncharacterized protein n=1 Tax=Hyaloscypha hepaticicola TaxID=2082293 RepID=A0A2J6Q545_9HELO|nr:hypothetical protein NA56DRAFT_125434 [Hyaloscypha hepaticicola]
MWFYLSHRRQTLLKMSSTWTRPVTPTHQERQAAQQNQSLTEIPVPSCSMRVLRSFTEQRRGAILSFVGSQPRASWSWGSGRKRKVRRMSQRKGVHQGALAGLFSLCRCIVTFLAVSLKIGEILSARRLYSRLCRMRRAKLCKSGPPFHSMVRSPSLTVSLGSICSHFDSTGGYELTKSLERIFNTATNDSGATVITVISNFILSDSQSISLTVARTVRICSPRLRLKLLVQCSKQCAAELTQQHHHRRSLYCTGRSSSTAAGQRHTVQY